MGLLTVGGDLDRLAAMQGAGPAAPSWAEFLTLFRELTKEPVPARGCSDRLVLKFLTPLLRQTYDEPEQRLEDLRKLRDLGERFEDRASFLAELTLDPADLDRGLGRRIGTGRRTFSF